MLDGLRADEETCADLLVRESLAEEAQHLDLPPREQPHRLRAGSALRAERAHERGGGVRLAERTERLELGSRVACRVDGDFRRADRQRARQLEPGSRGIEPKPESGETIHRVLEKTWRLLSSLGEREPTESGGGECRDAIAARDLRDHVERSRRCSGIVQSALGQSRLHQLGEQRRSKKVRPSELVEPADEQGGCRSRLSTREANRNSSLNSFRLRLEPREQLVRVVETPLEDTDLRQSCGRWDAARALPHCSQLAHSLLELRFRGVDPAVGGVHVRAACSAEREQRHVVIRADELLEHCAPLLGALAVAGTLAGEHQRAADVREGLEVGRLAARRSSHRLVESRETALDAAQRDLGEPELGECPQLEIRIVRSERDAERGRRELCSGRSVSRALRASEVEPAALGARRNVTEEAFGSREPATGRSVVAKRKPVLAGQPERDTRRPCQLAISAEAGIRSLAMNDRASLVAEPPERTPEPVEGLGRVGRIESLLKRVSRGFPVAARQGFVPTPEGDLRRGCRHDRIVAPSRRTRHAFQRPAACE